MEVAALLAASPRSFQIVLLLGIETFAHAAVL
jgi:hypothetical protein